MMKTYNGFPVHNERYRINHGIKERPLFDSEEGDDIHTEYVYYNHGVREAVPFPNLIRNESKNRWWHIPIILSIIGFIIFVAIIFSN